MDNRPIGVFDSGVGGLTVLREIRKLLPDENLIYFGDTARVPYGTKSKRTITAFAGQIVEFLLKKNVKLIVAACNTVSSNSLSYLKQHYPIPIIGVIEPGVELALKLTKNRHIGVIGTQSTINSKRYKILLLKSDKKLKISEKACPLFVPIAEEGLAGSAIAEMAIKNYLTKIKAKKIDTLILGCTHYPLLEKPLEKFFSKKVHLVNSGYAVSIIVKQLLSNKGLLNKRSRAGKISLFVSDLNETVLNVVKHTLELKQIRPKIISLD
ncbi:MAG: glutamate racemase [Spirochaetes bacterium]|nr:glutamate racemase [Spirochaetota bacterium]